MEVRSASLKIFQYRLVKRKEGGSYFLSFIHPKILGSRNFISIIPMVPELLYRPFPIIDVLRHRWKVSLFIGLFVFLFLGYFQPFGIHDLGPRRLMVVSIYAGICIGAIHVNFYLITRLPPYLLHESRWKTYHQGLFVFWTIFFIATSLLAVDYYLGIGDLSFPSIVENQLQVLSVAFFPVIIGFLAFQIRHLRMSGHPPSDPLVILKDSGQRNQVEIRLSRILYIMSAQNYVEIHWRDGDRTSRKLLRITMDKVAQTLKAHKGIYRCHRAYMVNTQNITKTVGNSRKLTLELRYTNAKIPVSRRHIQVFRERTNH